MGIAGLLQVLEPILTDIDLCKLRGKRVAVDGYAWLHRGCYSCAWELCTNTPTDKFLSFCAAMLDMLAHFGITPLIVLDGGPLPSKLGQEELRRHRREENLAKGKEALRLGNRSEALSHFQKAVDVTPLMAHQFELFLKSKGIEFIVAPFEADAQLAFLSSSGIVEAVITEDSDMIPYGVKNVIFKLTRTGQGKCLNFEDVLIKSELRNFNQEMIRQTCILAGCDYLNAVKGMGIRSAIKLMKKHRDAFRILRSLRLDSNFRFPSDYEDSFKKAELTFKFQQVYDPKNKKAIPLTPLPDDILWQTLESFLGKPLDETIAIGMAEGNLDPITKEPFPTIQTTTSASTSTSPSFNNSNAFQRRKETISSLPQRNTLLNYFKQQDTTPIRPPERSETVPSLFMKKSVQASKPFNPPRRGTSPTSPRLSTSNESQNQQQKNQPTIPIIVKSRFFSRMTQDCEIIPPPPPLITTANTNIQTSQTTIKSSTEPIPIIEIESQENDNEQFFEEEIKQEEQEEQIVEIRDDDENEQNKQQEQKEEEEEEVEERKGKYKSAFTTQGRLTLPFGHKPTILTTPNLDGFAYTSGESNDQQTTKATTTTITSTSSISSVENENNKQKQSPTSPSESQSNKGSIVDRLNCFLFDNSPRSFIHYPPSTTPSQHSQSQQSPSPEITEPPSKLQKQQ